MVTERQRTAFRYVFTDGLSYGEAALKMGTSQQAVSRLIGKIRRKYPEAVPKVSTRKPAQYEPSMDNESRQKTTWSETAQIAAARLDKICPQCLCTQDNGFVIEEKYAECWRCGWGFSFEDE